MEPVSAALDRGPVPISQAVKIVDRVCEILGAMHVAGRSHGAVSAASVRFRHVGGDLTVDLTPLGAPAAVYASPELVRGLEPSPHSDIYQVGVLLFHMVAGRPPFVGADDDETLRLHLTATPPSLEHLELQDVPAELDRLLQRMLAKDPRSRPKNVENIRSRISNLELDSTVMGLRLEALHRSAKELGAATPEMPEDTPTRVSQVPLGEDDTVLPNAPVVQPSMENQPVIRPPIEPPLSVVPTLRDGVDPFADTFIRDRSELDLDGPEDGDETQMTFPPERHPRAPQPNIIAGPRAVLDPPTAPTQALDASSPRLPAGPTQMSTTVALLIGFGVFVVTLATILWIAS